MRHRSATDITKTPTVEELIERRNRLIVLAREVRKTIAEMKSVYQPTSGEDDFGSSYDVDSFVMSPQSSFIDEEASVKAIDKKMWNHFVELSGIRTLMTEKAASDLWERLDKDAPEFTIENIEPILKNTKQFYGDTILNSVKEVYGRLIGCYYGSSGWNRSKRDNLREVNKTFRIRGDIYRPWNGNFAHEGWRSYTSFKYEDLYKVCKILDGKGVSNYSDTFHVQSEEQLKDGGDTISTRYFTVTCYKNGNQKITWKRFDILKLLNQIGGSHSNALPDKLKKKYKAEHFTS